MNTEPCYITGQRWLNFADPELGLGMISSIDKRHVQVSFPAVLQERTYAIEQAPLCRLIYRVGNEIQTTDLLTITVNHVIEKNGLLIYSGVDKDNNEHQVHELQINPVINFSAPLERLFAGYIDKHRDYKLKIETLHLSSRLQQSETRGLIGARIEHIPHQIYIASEVAKRFAPRVLLADEVGLGKTIEAGLILHHQLITGRAKRILIIVPQTLIHQWFIEMLRRFNLAFSIFNQERYQAISDEKPFETEQLIITSIDFLMSNSEARIEAQSTDWDLVVVDEAHHLKWSLDNPSSEYQCIEELATKTKGLLLLTATPEQLGIESHFARLRLLDSARYQSLSEFKKEELNFASINELATALIKYNETEKTDLISLALKQKVETTLNTSIDSFSITEILEILLDQHGTGRVLFRNTRQTIAGFPKRILNQYPLELPLIYQNIISDNKSVILQPETLVEPDLWLRDDPRVNWLIEKIRQLRPNKVLVITSQLTTALALEKHLRLTTNISASAFHEGLSVIERDKAAAYFADLEDGAECLICSEIGSEGRNFQFASDLILFDLPLSPDLLEQRIGRLDRIGQKSSINIHVPLIENTPMAAIFNWYNAGLNLFEKSCSFGFTIYEKFKDELLDILKSTAIDNIKLNKLIEQTKSQAILMQQQAELGRNRLLELSSCNTEKATELFKSIEQQESPQQLQDYMNKVFNKFGVSHEPHSDSSEILKPSEHMESSYFPGLKEDGNTVTYSREKALVREDIEFLSFEHPMVRESMAMILSENSGSAVLCTMSLKALPPGTLLLEAFYTPQAIAPEALELNRYLPITPIRILMSLDGKNIDKVISHQQLSSLCKRIKRHLAPPIISQIREHIEAIATDAKKHAESLLEQITQTATEKLNNELGQELSRIVALKKVNLNIRQEEVDFIENQMLVTKKAIGNAIIKLEGIRVIVNK